MSEEFADLVGQVDVAFVIDSTGSMGPFIEAARQHVRAIAEEVAAVGDLDLRFAVVAYRDHPPQEASWVTRVTPFGDGDDLQGALGQLVQLRRSAFGDVWRRCAPRAGLPDDATFHDLRHFYASLLIARNCSIKAVQKRLGHQSATETLDTYSHLWPDSDDETRAAVDSVLSRVAV